MSIANEVFGWAARFSEETQRRERIANLRRRIAETGNRCGDCDHWMKSRECPRERNVDGMSRGPSAGGLICPSFREKLSSARHREALKAELAARLASEAAT